VVQDGIEDFPDSLLLGIWSCKARRLHGQLYAEFAESSRLQISRLGIDRRARGTEHDVRMPNEEAIEHAGSQIDVQGVPPEV
jgi:hypothetical protein